MPTREQVEAELAKLPPEQHAAFLAEVERRMQGAVTHPGAPAEAATPSEAAPDIRPAFDRFISGTASTALPGMDTLSAIGGALADTPAGLPMPVIERGDDGKIHVRPSKSISLWLDTLKGMMASHGEQFSKAGESARNAAELGAEGDIGGAARQAAATIGYTGAGLLPLVGPAAAHAGERIASGDVAGGLGEGAGLATALLPFGKKFAGGVETRAVKGLENWAGSDIAKVVGARRQDVPDIMRNTRTIAEGLGVGNREKLLDRVKGAGSLTRKKGPHDPESLLGKAENKLSWVKGQPNLPVDVMPVAQKVRNTAPKFKNPLPGPTSFDRELVAATEDWAEQIEGKAFAHGTPRVQPGPMSAGAPAQPGLVPAEEAFLMRTQAGDVAGRKGGFKANPLGEVSPGGVAGASTHGELGSLLKQAYPGLAEADLGYSAWRQVGDLLLVAAEKDVIKKASAIELLGIKLPISGALGQLTMGAGMGAGAGALAGSASIGAALGGAYGAFQVAKDIANSAYFRSLSAATKIKVANAIKSGALTTAEVSVRAGGVTVPAVSRYSEPQPPEEQP